MKTFIRVIEVWVPAKDRTQLEFADGLYGPLRAFWMCTLPLYQQRGVVLP